MAPRQCVRKNYPTLGSRFFVGMDIRSASNVGINGGQKVPSGKYLTWQTTTDSLAGKVCVEDCVERDWIFFVVKGPAKDTRFQIGR